MCRPHLGGDVGWDGVGAGGEGAVHGEAGREEGWWRGRSARCSWAHGGFHCCPLPFPFQEKKDVHACVVCRRYVYIHPHSNHTRTQGHRPPPIPAWTPNRSQHPRDSIVGKGGGTGEPQMGEGTRMAPGLLRECAGPGTEGVYIGCGLYICPSCCHVSAVLVLYLCLHMNLCLYLCLCLYHF